eukprot:m51a1_g8317 hypothetical protein (855) ;mRNA; r:113413-116592
MAFAIAGGAKAVELTHKQDEGYLSVVTSYWKRPKPPEHHSNEIITWASFDHYSFDGSNQRKCLVMAYTTGFQVWDLEDMSDVREVCSRRDVSIKVARFLAGPPSQASGPLLALASAEEAPSFPRTTVRLFSLRRRDYVKGIRFASEVLNILSSPRVLLVALRDRLFGFDSSTAERVFSVETFPSIVPWQVCALGARWLAYAGRDPVGPPGTARPERGALARIATDVLKGAAYLGEVAGKSVTSVTSQLLSGTSPPTAGPAAEGAAAAGGQGGQGAGCAQGADEELGEGAGSVVVMDVATQRVLAHFYAHAQPISLLAWDQSGSLLVTADAECRSFHVYRVCPDETAAASGTAPPLLYRLWRGMTSASVLGIELSSDSRWLAACSARGTTHVYAVYPLGGPALTLTHVPATTPNRVPGTPGFVFGGRIPASQELASVHRIKGGMVEGARFAQAAAFSGVRQLMHVSGSGVLSLYALEPHAEVQPPPAADAASPTSAAGGGQQQQPQQQQQQQGGAQSPPGQSLQDATVLAVAVRRVGQWDVCRKSTWAEFCSPAFAEQAAAGTPSPPLASAQGSNDGWLSNVEIVTHASFAKPIWASPLFTFHAFAGPEFEPRPDNGAAAPQEAAGDDGAAAATACDEATPTRRVEVHREAPALTASARVYDEMVASMLTGAPGGNYAPVQQAMGAPLQPIRLNADEPARPAIAIQRSRDGSSGPLMHSPTDQLHHQQQHPLPQLQPQQQQAAQSRAAQQEQGIALPPSGTAAAAGLATPSEDLLAAMMTPMHSAPEAVVDRNFDEAAPLQQASRGAMSASLVESVEEDIHPEGEIVDDEDEDEDEGIVFNPFSESVPRGVAGHP